MIFNYNYLTKILTKYNLFFFKGDVCRNFFFKKKMLKGHTFQFHKGHTEGAGRAIGREEWEVHDNWEIRKIRREKNTLNPRTLIKIRPGNIYDKNTSVLCCKCDTFWNFASDAIQDCHGPGHMVTLALLFFPCGLL